MAAKQNRFKSSRKETERSKRGNRREWGRIANRLLLLVAVLGFVYGVERLSAKLDAIPVERVVFAGDLQRVDRDVLVERVTGQLAVGYIGLDLEAIQAELEQEPWVYRAVVERLWPRELKITIVEETPIAVWGRGGLLNHRGRIFVPQDGSDYGADLPRLDGPKGSAIEIMRQYRLMSQLLGDEQLTLQHLEMDARGSWTARIDENVELVLGRQEPLEKLRRFLWVYRKYLAADFATVARVDMRYINGLAVARTQHSDKG
ncbi:MULTISPECIES: cell division protein FtsQ/DivIB [Spongiibacter]|jgi:cell division protein FtsQ|uniref:cell division protein FtsQ/DivIB n=1 Tax=Spongiibacter TaxID=630749 RepID=UPI000C09B31D|nr:MULTISPECIES: cell division protein FtsQ/DivIB [unclassified Spongiibacter]MAK44286.1 cell division protein FtsQ [Spongiibacter sp.]MEE2651756.1 cell division protein FtsQ/DivIB [Pseudomonadota bacterium]|tara:strand:+ start:2704 stop:3483 length:780 start_codon:yes stop_codon:yes gene_type:complete